MITELEHSELIYLYLPMNLSFHWDKKNMFCITYFLFKIYCLFHGLEYFLSWRMFHVYLIKMYMMLLLNEMFY